MTTRFDSGKSLSRCEETRTWRQEELAAYMGVSKSSVSKWETETTLPDILLLPQLTTLFNVSVDELIGYEPQLSMERNKLYLQLSAEWAGQRQCVCSQWGADTQILLLLSFLLQMAGFISITTCCMKNQNWLWSAVRSCVTADCGKWGKQSGKDAISWK